MNAKSLRLVIVGLVLAALLVGDLAMTFATAQEQVVQEQPVKKKRKTLMDMLFGPKDPVVVEQPAVPTEQPKRKPAPAASLPPAKPKVEKAPNATRLAVFGDSLATDLAKALERFYAEDPNLVIIDQGVGSSGFVRQDFFDWDKAVHDQIAANSFDLAVMIIGINDRQQLSADGQSYKSLTDDWKRIYSSRVSAVAGQFRAANKPVIWIGLPPMSKGEYSQAIAQISALQRLASFSGGAEFLDIYEKFADEEGKYTSYGPDLNGQRVKMRKDDGIHFSTAGAAKLAFYVSQSIKLYYRGGGVSIEIADPLAGTDAGSMVRPPYQGLGQIRLLEVAGAVVPLGRVSQRAAALLTANDQPLPAEAFDLAAMMKAPEGRADAFGAGFRPEEALAANAGGR